MSIHSIHSRMDNVVCLFIEIPKTHICRIFKCLAIVGMQCTTESNIRNKDK